MTYGDMMKKHDCSVIEVKFDDITAWLLDLHIEGYLLAHALDGVIWGKIVDGQLVTSSPLHIETLQELRLFNRQREIHVWHTGDTWHARQIVDEEGISEDDYIEESHILWGTRGKPVANGFTQMHHRGEGLSHTVPIDATKVNEQQSRLYLCVRHYFGEDDNGVNYIAYSRIVSLDVKEFEDES